MLTGCVRKMTINVVIIKSVCSKNTLDFNDKIKYNNLKLIREHDDGEAKCAECTESRQLV